MTGESGHVDTAPIVTRIFDVMPRATESNEGRGQIDQIHSFK